MQRLLIEIRVLSHRKLYWKEGKTIKNISSRRLDKVEAIDASSDIAILIQRQFCEPVNWEKSPNLRIHPQHLFKAETLLQLLASWSCFELETNFMSFVCIMAS